MKLKTQSAPGFTVVPQPPPWRVNAAAPDPEAMGLGTWTPVSGDPPVLVSVSFWIALATPTACVGKVSVAGESTACAAVAGGTDVAIKNKFAVPPVVFTEKVAVNEPCAVGAKITLYWQFASAARLVVQVVPAVGTENRFALTPVILGLERLIGEVPGLNRLRV